MTEQNFEFFIVTADAGTWAREKLTPTGWHRMISELRNPNLKSLMNTLRTVDDQISDWADQLGTYVVRLEGAYKDHRMSDFTTISGHIAERLRNIVEKKNTLQEAEQVYKERQNAVKKEAQLVEKFKNFFKFDPFHGSDQKPTMREAGFLLNLAKNTVAETKMLSKELKKARAGGRVDHYTSTLAQIGGLQEKFQKNYERVYENYLKTYDPNEVDVDLKGLDSEPTTSPSTEPAISPKSSTGIFFRNLQEAASKGVQVLDDKKIRFGHRFILVPEGHSYKVLNMAGKPIHPFNDDAIGNHEILEFIHSVIPATEEKKVEKKKPEKTEPEPEKPKKTKEEEARAAEIKKEQIAMLNSNPNYTHERKKDKKTVETPPVKVELALPAAVSPIPPPDSSAEKTKPAAKAEEKDEATQGTSTAIPVPGQAIPSGDSVVKEDKPKEEKPSGKRATKPKKEKKSSTELLLIKNSHIQFLEYLEKTAEQLPDPLMLSNLLIAYAAKIDDLDPETGIELCYLAEEILNG